MDYHYYTKDFGVVDRLTTPDFNNPKELSPYDSAIATNLIWSPVMVAGNLSSIFKLNEDILKD